MAKKPKLTRKDLEVLGWPSKSEKPIKKDKPVKKGHEWQEMKKVPKAVIKKKPVPKDGPKWTGGTVVIKKKPKKK